MQAERVSNFLMVESQSVCMPHFTLASMKLTQMRFSRMHRKDATPLTSATHVRLSPVPDPLAHCTAPPYFSFSSPHHVLIPFPPPPLPPRVRALIRHRQSAPHNHSHCRRDPPEIVRPRCQLQVTRKFSYSESRHDFPVALPRPPPREAAGRPVGNTERYASDIRPSSK